MTNTEIYNLVSEYSTLRAKKGCAKDKKYWVSELRILRHLVDHEIIMSRGSNGNANDSTALQDSYDNLHNALKTALEFVHENH